MKHTAAKTLSIGITGYLLLATSALHAQVASFDCRKAATASEHAVCDSSELGRKDVTVAAYYQLLLRLKPAMAGMTYREFDDSVRAAQRQWVQHDRDACGGDTACLQHAYDQRIDALLKTFDTQVALTYGRTFD
jgi:uncharacterized protein